MQSMLNVCQGVLFGDYCSGRLQHC